MIGVALLLVMQAAAAPQAPASSTQGVQLGVTVRPETVTVGTRFVVAARLRAPEGATIAWPVAPVS
jgi:hypothetical protein